MSPRRWSLSHQRYILPPVGTGTCQHTREFFLLFAVDGMSKHQRRAGWQVTKSWSSTKITACLSNWIIMWEIVSRSRLLRLRKRDYRDNQPQTGSREMRAALSRDVRVSLILLDLDNNWYLTYLSFRLILFNIILIFILLIINNLEQFIILL